MINILPTWIPNIHPLIIHFPIAILMLAIAFQFFALIVNRPKGVETGLLILLVGIVSLIVTYFSGRAAVETVLLPAQANPILNSHADLALWTLIYFVCLGLLILLAWKMDQVKNKTIAISVFLLGVVGVGMLAKTADYGGQLVYRYGVGVSKNESNSILSNTVISERDSAIIFMENGSWIWNTSNDQSNSWVNDFEWLEGSFDIDGSIELITDDDAYRVIPVNNAPMFFVAGKILESVQVDLSVDLTDFEGDFKVVHHVNDRDNFDYFSITKSMAEIGRVERSKQTIWSEEEAPNDGLVTIRVVGMNRHFRGYINDKLVVHSHADDLPPGKVGLFIQGTGTIRINNMKVQVITMDHTE